MLMKHGKQNEKIFCKKKILIIIAISKTWFTRVLVRMKVQFELAQK